MKSHVLRPLWVAIVLVASIFLVRMFLVPEDFGVHGDSFTYNYYRLGNVQEGKDFPAKYTSEKRCRRCHDENAGLLKESKHANLRCQNCHGPGAGHPKEIEKLPINASREHCLRCHQRLPYPSSQRADLPGIDGATHKKNKECRKCHDPHHPDLEDM